MNTSISGRTAAKTNYRLKDGDQVTLLQPARVDGYWYNESTMIRGCWDSHMMLPGCQGTVVRARTPAVTSPDGRTQYFANVEIAHQGVVSRIRVFHDQIQRVRRNKGAHA